MSESEEELAAKVIAVAEVLGFERSLRILAKAAGIRHCVRCGVAMTPPEIRGLGRPRCICDRCRARELGTGKRAVP